MRKIGISLRICNAESYQESRDAIAHDWYVFLDSLECGVNWILLPNLGRKTVEYAKYHNIEALILTGGNDIGSSNCRDVSENELLNFAASNNLPILGICRGLQLLYKQSGGELVESADMKHVATRHHIDITTRTPFEHSDGAGFEVNSYHTTLLKPGYSNFKTMARDKSGFIEGVIDIPKKIAGIMWHPERELSFSSFDRALFNWLFKD